MAEQKSLRLADLAGLLKLPYEGDGNLVLTGMAALDTASSSQLSFLANAKYVSRFCYYSRTIIHHWKLP